MRALTALLTIAVAGCAVPTLTSTSADGARSLKLTASVSRPVAGEAYRISGVMPTNGTRTVELQKYSGGWKRLGLTTRTSSTGKYSFTVRTAGSFRAYAKAARVGGTNRSSVTTPTLKVTPGIAKSTVRIIPSVSQRGSSLTSSAGAKDVLIATFSPVRKGRTVVFQKLVGNKWTNQAYRKQNSRGEASYTADLGSTTQWQAKTVAPWPGSNDVARSSWTAKLNSEFTSASAPSSAVWVSRYPGVRSDSKKCAVGSGAAEFESIAGGALKLSNKAVTSTRTCRTSYGTFRRYKFGHVGTAAGFQYQNGVAAARIKFSRGTGAHGAFWLQGNRPGGAEIDTVEYFGARRDGGLGNTVHYKDSSGRMRKAGGIQSSASRAIPADDEFYKSYHVYSVEWTPSRYIFRLDGYETFRTSRGVSKVPEFPVLSIASSDYELVDRHTTTESMSVDWVNVYQKTP
ncbi:MAG: glcA [Aeromicrobium sp.]|nr:glcA [Aeromicrobium sp.]